MKLISKPNNICTVGWNNWSIALTANEANWLQAEIRDGDWHTTPARLVCGTEYRQCHRPTLRACFYDSPKMRNGWGEWSYSDYATFYLDFHKEDEGKLIALVMPRMAMELLAGE